ncbi:hypothetical protein [Paenibacillus sp. OK003]|uniref:hypothetical protein n=1 Tax=Paenibacillus sp. OK003 TaxID=1884380 RepID=UPI0008BA637E|nr:hypothetical protein [Paenibacillus sp. OK003]SEL14186.1 hypothetical protein SAMN05518856_1087 [Paenibacillus sp. OK003]
MMQRIELNPGWTREEVAALTANSELKIVQYSEHNIPGVDLMQILNEELFANRPDVTFRIYGFHSQSGDLSVLKYMNHVELETIRTLSSLRSLYVSGMPLKELGYLKDLTGLRELHLSFGGAENLDSLAGMESLQLLKLLRVKGLSDLSVLPELKNLTELQRVFLNNVNVESTIGQRLPKA